MRCNDCTHYDVCYQYDIIGEDDNEMCALYEQKRKHGEWKKESAIDYLTEIGWLPEHDRILTERPHGEWIDHSDEGYVECPFCDHATTCDDNIEELHYCFFCGAELRKSGESE